jgi:hypothetical protein
MRGSMRLARLFVVAALGWVACHGAACAANPYGVMLFPNPGEDYSLTLARARGLGVTWFRPPTVALKRWEIGKQCPTCAVFARSGLALAITVRNVADPSGQEVSHPPADPEAFRKTLESVVAAWSPSLVAIESDENTPASYDGGADGPQAYLAELNIACSVAHAHRALCTNGGLTGQGATAVTWLGFLAAGQADRACDFAKRALPGEDLCGYKKAADVPQALRQRLAGTAEALVDAYRAVPIDMVNFHWFGRDTQAFAEVAEYLAHATGKPAITNEFGQRKQSADPQGVRPLLRAVIAENMPLAIWYSVDTANTVSLFGRDGLLRPTGWEFQRQLSGLR